MQINRSAQLVTLTLLLLATVATVADGIIRPSNELNVMSGNGFLAYLEVAKSFGTIRNCWFRFAATEKIRIALNETEPLVTSRGEYVLPFAPTVCGIRVSKLSAASAAKWTLEVENVDGDVEESVVNVIILPEQPTQLETRVVRELGNGEISCKRHETYTKRCKIIDAETGDAWPVCSLNTAMRPNRTFVCLTFNLGRMPTSYEHITVDISASSSAHANATQTETETHLVLNCQLPEKPYYCYAESPNHTQELFINEGLYDGARYSAYDTILTKPRCSLELQKPLAEHESGLWRIYSYRTDDTSGCLFYVGAERDKIIADELARLSTETHVINRYLPKSQSTTPSLIGEISCMLPFAVDECYLRDPNSVVYFPDKNQFTRSASYGKCSFKNVPQIAGIWICGARSAAYDKEVLQEIEVLVKSEQGEVLTPHLKAQLSDSIQLMCRTAYEAPITRCVFVDPQKNVHLVASARSQKTSGHVHYFGRGLEYGECGIKINGLNSDDFGSWRCQFGGASLSLDSSFDMLVKESVLGQATSIGLGIGLTVIIVLMAGVVIATVFYRRRNLSAQHNFPSADPLEVFNAPQTTPTYNEHEEMTTSC